MQIQIFERLEGRRLLAAAPPMFSGTASDADFNIDGTINSADFAILAAAWNVPGAKSRAQGDANLDGKANTIDFNVLTKWWGASYTIAPDTPGPADGRYEYTLTAGQSLGSISPKPGDDVRFLGDWPKINFPWTGTTNAPVHIWFATDSTVGDGQTGVVVQGGQYLDIHGLHVLNVKSGGQLQATGGSAVKINTGTTLDGALIEDVEAIGVAIFGSGAKILNSTIRRAGQLGFGTQFAKDVLIDNVKILNCNNGLANPSWKNFTASGYTVVMQLGGIYFVNPDWEAGATKLWSSDAVTIRNSEFAYNVGPGIWPDYKNTNHTYEGNYIHDNRGLDSARFYQGEGIRLELSPSAGGFTVRNNRIENNTGAGVTLTSVRDVTISGNSFAGNYTGVLLRRDDGRGGIFNVLASGNTYAGSKYTVWGSSSPWGNVVIDGAVLA